MNLKRTARISSTLFLVLLALLLSLLFLFDRFIQFRDSDEELATFFNKRNIPAKIGYYQSEGRKLRHIAVGNLNAPVCILFLHGAPSSLSYFKKYFSDTSLLQRAYMIAIDRPGYGYSGFGVPETSMAAQAKMIRPLLDSRHDIHQPVIVVGVSYGTSIACRLAMDFPGLVDGLVLVAPSLAPGEEKIYTIAYPIQFPFLQWAVPRMLVSANAEKLSHRKELEKMQASWKNIKVPVSYLQGEDDQLIYPSNAAFARRMLVNAACLDIQIIPHRGHLIMFSEIKKIKQSILEMTELAEIYYSSTKKNQGRLITSK